MSSFRNPLETVQRLSFWIPCYMLAAGFMPGEHSPPCYIIVFVQQVKTFEKWGNHLLWFWNRKAKSFFFFFLLNRIQVGQQFRVSFVIFLCLLMPYHCCINAESSMASSCFSKQGGWLWKRARCGESSSVFLSVPAAGHHVDHTWKANGSAAWWYVTAATPTAFLCTFTKVLCDQTANCGQAS